jgi:hypothetical protein
MLVLDLFAGTGSSTAAFTARGHEVYHVELDRQHQAELYADIATLEPRDLRRLVGERPIDFLWASPPCTAFSVASIGHHWIESKVPRTAEARKALLLVEHVLALVEALAPRYYVLENPRGMLRKLLPRPGSPWIPRATVTYCQYGDDRQKPTDLWGRFPKGWLPRPKCRASRGCHEPARRGARTGTQGRQKVVDRSRVPYELSLELCLAVEAALASEVPA